MSLPSAGWNTGLPFCKKSWHLQKFSSTEKMSHFPPEKENLWGGKKKGKIIAWKNQTIPNFFFSQCRTEEQLPLSPEYPSSHELSRFKSQWASACARAPVALGFPWQSSASWVWERLSSQQHHLKLTGNQPCCSWPASAIWFKFYLSPTWVWDKSLLARKFLTRLSWHVTCYRVTHMTAA